MAITASQIEKAVNNQCMFDGSSIEGFVRIDESDQYLYPDLKSYRVFPWTPQDGKVARMICDVYNVDGTPFAGDPRYVLKAAIQKARDMASTPSTWALRRSFSSFRPTMRASPPPRPTTRRAISTWALWTTASPPGGRYVWHWRP